MNALTPRSTYDASAATPDQCLRNVEFQLQNVQGWMRENRPTSARIKAECLVAAAQKLVACLKELET